MKLEQLKVIAHGIATQFGASCEVLIHDVQIETLESSIVYIEHGDISNRDVGDGASHAVMIMINYSIYCVSTMILLILLHCKTL